MKPQNPNTKSDVVEQNDEGTVYVRRDRTADGCTLVETAMTIALKAHEGQLDKGGNPYILHVMAVALNFTAPKLIAISLLHDVIEDSDWQLQDLDDEGIPSSVVRAVDAISRRENESYKNYLKRVKADPWATQVKIADIKHNLMRDRVNDGAVRRAMEENRPMYYQALAMLDRRA